jgi:hypothetical protein
VHRVRVTAFELAAFMVVALLVLLVVEGQALTDIVHGSGDAGDETAGSDQPSGLPASGASSQAETGASEAQAQQLLTTMRAIGSDRLPGSSCAVGDAHVTCRNPASNIQMVVLTPYASPVELYDAYTDAVRGLSGDPVPENTGDCSGDEFEGELTWNLDLGHGRDVSVADEVAGGLDPATEVAGRIFCTESSDVLKLVWTQDPGLLVTATGQPARLTIGWWHDVHVALACSMGGTGTGCT